MGLCIGRCNGQIVNVYHKRKLVMRVAYKTYGLNQGKLIFKAAKDYKIIRDELEKKEDINHENSELFQRYAFRNLAKPRIPRDPQARYDACTQQNKQPTLSTDRKLSTVIRYKKQIRNAPQKARTPKEGITFWPAGE